MRSLDPDRILAIACDVIARFEGCELHAYLCPAGVWTIGYGTTRIDDKPVTRLTPPITKDKAKQLLRADAYKFYLDILKAVEKELTANQYAALVSFVYNIGSGAFRRSTLLKKLNKGDISGASAQFPRWVKSQGKTLDGLVRRREAERELFDAPD